MPARNARVYLIDSDDQVLSELTEGIKEKENIEIVGKAKDGKKALEEIEQSKPDLVILDVVLSALDGFSVIEKILSNPGIEPKPKFLVVSSLVHNGFITKAVNLGVSYYMLKPIPVEVVLDRMDDVLKCTEKPKAHFPDTKKISLAFEERITNIFLMVGIPAHIKGYQFLREAIKMTIDAPDMINSITKKLYPSIAEKFETSASKVERAIRHAIEVAWNRGKIENINNIFGLKIYNSNEKPTNGEFIALVADKMLIEGA